MRAPSNAMSSSRRRLARSPSARRRCSGTRRSMVVMAVRPTRSADAFMPSVPFRTITLLTGGLAQLRPAFVAVSRRRLEIGGGVPTQDPAMPVLQLVDAVIVGELRRAADHQTV